MSRRDVEAEELGCRGVFRVVDALEGEAKALFCEQDISGGLSADVNRRGERRYRFRLARRARISPRKHSLTIHIDKMIGP